VTVRFTHLFVTDRLATDVAPVHATPTDLREVTRRE